MKRLLQYRNTLITGLVLGLFSAAFIRTAWVAEDAFITFRVIDNLLSGFGPVWNIGERVQVYTHPLWMFLLTSIVAILGDPYWSALLLSYALCIGTWLLVMHLCRPLDLTLLGVLALLLMSRALLDYSSSGLENPLTYFLYACFCAIWLGKEDSPRKSGLLGVVAVSLYLTRPDAIVILLPALVHQLYCDVRNKAAILAWLPGVLIFLSWTLFSLFYYGSPVPNTALAKVGTGLGLWQKAQFASRYVLWSAIHDPVTPAVIISAVLLGIWIKERSVRLLVAGLGLWLIYLAVVGADYMGGRFLSAAVVISAVILVTALRCLTVHPVAPWLMALTSIYSLSFTLFSATGFTNTFIPREGIADERGFYYQQLGLLPVLQRGGNWATHPWFALGTEVRDRPGMYASCVIGMFGYAAKTTPFLLDPLALADPFLARLPSREGARPGHYERAFPAGYLEARLTGQNKIEDPYLAELWNMVQNVTQGPLWSWERVAMIAKLNVSASQLVKQSHYDRNAVGLPGLDRQSTSLLSCLGQPPRPDPMWEIIPVEQSGIVSVPIAQRVGMSHEP